MKVEPDGTWGQCRPRRPCRFSDVRSKEERIEREMSLTSAKSPR